MLTALYRFFLYRYFEIRNSWCIWFAIVNRRARALFKKNPLPLSTEGERIVRSLRESGIATTTLEALFLNERAFENMTHWIKTHEPKENMEGKKKFLREYFDLIPDADLDDIFLKYAIDERVLAIAQHYLEMWVQLTHYHLAETLPQEGTPVQSQRWHRDPEEKRILKMFIYLNDVDEEAGPFTYAKKTVYGQEYGHLFPQKPPEGSYPSEESVISTVPYELIESMIAPAGTVIFCDTSGLHFGGRAKSKSRFMFTASYHAPSFTEGVRYTVTQKTKEQLKGRGPAVAFALSGKRIRTEPLHH
ncbi:MAG: hypothetical protein COV08_02475 [Candidatus Vogelbacteria bacterium CG10_big_fil_rev_8_21_14_0_10_49_38]|uniref:Phytanoyl-CoA dioxygenase n=1 Tax=Candidatus Vogelbacteria bacterium CG10_big_fil_rev_8_21_14_0_10_49_38 TaxID=1975043 RepID=A0A2H0RHB9_9BACT|nr:MAG: hypothetical protein BK006_02495 [bacterium CG10_49_38]PIR45929.1 MAG: hypothetical protein COV08_02475 [Candidatus Vogelbacteria bacterium CG10_big_fil_rev_8_21_14_0_10_49_38]